MNDTRSNKKSLLSCYVDREMAEAINVIAQNESLSRSLVMRLAMKKFILYYNGGVYNVL